MTSVKFGDIFPEAGYYICDHCGFTTKIKQLYDTHMVSECVNIPKCKYCKLKFQTIKELENHNYSCLTHCQYCHKNVSNISSSNSSMYLNDSFQNTIKANVIRHERECLLNTTCNVCKHKFDSKSELDTHVKEAKDLELKCSHCGHVFVNSNAKTSHEKQCGVRNFKYRCDHCLKYMGSRCALTLHEIECICENTCALCKNYDPIVGHVTLHCCKDGKYHKEFVCTNCSLIYLCPFCHMCYLNLEKHIITCSNAVHVCNSCKSKPARTDSNNCHNCESTQPEKSQLIKKQESCSIM